MRIITLFLIFASLNVTAQYDEFIITELKAHEGAANCIAFSPDGKTLASGGEDNLVKTWNLETQENILSLSGHFKGIKALVYSNQGDRLFSAGDRSIRVWSKDGTEEKVLTGHTTFLWSLNISKDDNYLISGSFDRQFHIWDFHKTDEGIEIDGHKKSVLAVNFSPDGKYMVSGSLDKTIKLWDFKTKELLKTFEGHSDNIYDIKFLPNSKYFISASRDKTVRLWSVEKGEIVKTYPGHKNGVVSIDISPDGNLLLSSSFDGEIKLWEIATANNLYTFEVPQQAVNCVRFSPDGKSFATASQDGIVRLWDINKSIFVNYYFESELLEDMNNSDLFLPKQKGESRIEFKQREEAAELAKEKLFEKYYMKYLQMQKNSSFN